MYIYAFPIMVGGWQLIKILRLCIRGACGAVREADKMGEMRSIIVLLLTQVCLTYGFQITGLQSSGISPGLSETVGSDVPSPRTQGYVNDLKNLHVILKRQSLNYDGRNSLRVPLLRALLQHSKLDHLLGLFEEPQADLDHDASSKTRKPTNRRRYNKKPLIRPLSASHYMLRGLERRR